MKNAIDVAINESLTNRAIVESFMEGPEYSAECICYEGQINILAYTKKITTESPHYIECGHIQPSDLTESIKEKAEDTIKKAIRALDIKNSAAHVEFRVIDENNIGIIEIGARMGGDNIGTSLTPISTGYDYIKMVIEVACGLPPDFTQYNSPTNVCIRFIMDEKDLSDLNKMKEDPLFVIHSVFINDTNFNKEIKDGSDRHGYWIFSKIQ